MFEKINDWDEVNGSHLQGYVFTTYDELVKTFGEPHCFDGDKTTVEWMLKFDNGDVVTIYDYKEWETPKHLYQWHIGGFNKNAKRLVIKALAGAGAGGLI